MFSTKQYRVEPNEYGELGNGSGDPIQTIQLQASSDSVVKDELAGFDYSAEAELYPSRNKKSNRRSIGYRRFGRAADAIRFAIEVLPPEFLLGACLEVDEERYDKRGIRGLYERADYPLSRSAGS